MLIVSGQLLAGGNQKKDNPGWGAETFGERGQVSPCLSGNSEATIILYKQPQHRQPVIQAASGLAPLTFGERGQASPCLSGNPGAIHRHVSPASLRFKV